MSSKISLPIAAILLFAASQGVQAASCDHFIKKIPIVISEAGIWCLANSLDIGDRAEDAVTIKSGNVTLDGQGYTVSGPIGPSAVSRGVIAFDVTDLTVRDIKLRGFGVGVQVADTSNLVAGTSMFEEPRKSRRVNIDQVEVTQAAKQGIHVRADVFSITNSTVSYIGPSTESPHAFSTGIMAVGNACAIAGNAVFGGNPVGNGEIIGIALYKSVGCRVENNTVTFNKWFEYGRNYGIWTRPEAGGMPLVSNNFVSGAHYAFGPAGAFKGNLGADLSCGLFANRVAPPDKRFDLGENIGIMSTSSVMPGDATCPDDPEFAINRFVAKRTAEAAYAVATAYAEQDPVKSEIQTLTWLTVAAHLGHELAKAPAASPESNGYSAGTYAKAYPEAQRIIGAYLREFPEPRPEKN